MLRLGLLLAFCLTGNAAEEGHPARGPHVLFILADDYGWSNIGFHRKEHCRGDKNCEQAKKEVHTPTLDRLAAEGVILDRHYAFRICAPSRSSLQSGRLAIHVNMKNVGVTYNNPDDPISGYAGIPRDMTGMAEKIRHQGYKTHMVGKWDAGMATPHHTPRGRGYDSWTGYFQHANDYWTKAGNIQATGTVDNCLNHFTDFFHESEEYRGGVLNKTEVDSSCRDSTAQDPPCYEEYIFKEKAKGVMRRHMAAHPHDDVPLFLMYSFHLMHTPLQVPVHYQKEIQALVDRAGGDGFTSENRMLYAAMALYLDDTVSEFVRELKKLHMYDNTLIIFASDNGGPVYEPGSANNHPLKGGKYSDWEGGVRTNAFISGGFVPHKLRGSTHEHIVSIADWYATICVVAGGSAEYCTSDPKADAANLWIKEQNLHRESPLPLLPGIDSKPQWDAILQKRNGRPGPFHLSENALIDWPMKLIMGVQNYSAWQGPLYPNCSTIANYAAGNGPAFVDFKVFGEPVTAEVPQNAERLFWSQDCTKGCLFNVSADPSEHIDLASHPKYALKLLQMKATLADLNKSLFLPNRGEGVLKACTTSMYNGGYYGPFLDLRGYYTGPLKPENDLKFKATLLLVNSDKIKDGIQATVQTLSPAISWYSQKNGSIDTCLPCEEAAAVEAWQGNPRGVGHYSASPEDATVLESLVGSSATISQVQLGLVAAGAFAAGVAFAVCFVACYARRKAAWQDGTYSEQDSNDDESGGNA